MFRRPVAVHLFSLMQEQRYLFDVELLWWANRLGYRVNEVRMRVDRTTPRPASRVSGRAVDARWAGEVTAQILSFPKPSPVEQASY